MPDPAGVSVVQSITPANIDPSTRQFKDLIYLTNPQGETKAYRIGEGIDGELKLYPKASGFAMDCGGWDFRTARQSEAGDLSVGGFQWGQGRTPSGLSRRLLG